MPFDENDEPTGQTEGIDVDALMEQIDAAPDGNLPADPAKADPAGAEGAQTPAAQAPQYPKEIELTIGGKPIKAPWEKALQWAQQGYDYSQKMASFNQDRAKWDDERKGFEKTISPYKAIDEYAKQNPDWWKHVESAYQSRTTGQPPGASANPDLESVKAALKAELEAEFKPIKEQFTSIQEEKAAKAREAEDTALSTEVQSIQEKYPNLDWKSVDENGHSLEQRVLKHGMDNNIPSFRAAFRDYTHDDLLKLHEERGKENQVKELQKQRKQGLLGSSPTPKKGIARAEGVKNKSYEDLMREALTEEGIA
jgi:hypothetical protein